MALDRNRWRCQNCKTVTNDDKLLRAASPFDPDDELYGCPNCKSVDQFDEICDEAGCYAQAGCGFPVEGPDRYRRTCFAHSPWNRK